MSKSKRKYQAIESMEKGIAAYLTINSILDLYDGSEHAHMPVAKFVAKATLNELLSTYMEKNNEQQLQALIEKLSLEATQGSDDSPSEPAGIPSV